MYSTNRITIDIIHNHYVLVSVVPGITMTHMMNNYMT